MQEIILEKRYAVQTGILRLKKEYLNSIYVDKIIGLLEQKSCIIKNFCSIAGGGITFYLQNDKNARYVGVTSTRQQRLAKTSCPDWKRVFAEVEKSFRNH